MSYPGRVRVGIFLLSLFFLQGIGCGNGTLNLTLTGTFNTTVAAQTNFVQYSCDSVAFIAGQDNSDLLNLSTTHQVPVGVNGVPVNGSVIEILPGALVQSNQDVVTFQITCFPAQTGIFSFDPFTIFFGENSFTSGNCGGDCTVNVPLQGIDETALGQLTCPTLDLIFLFVFTLCNPTVDPTSVACLTLELVQQAAAIQGCTLSGSIPGGGSGGGEEVVCGDNVLHAEEECDESAATGGDCGPGRCVDPGETGPNGEPECTCTPPGTACGNGQLTVATGESCDDGNTLDDGNGCSADCVDQDPGKVCGNGIVEADPGGDEECDGALDMACTIVGEVCGASCLCEASP